MSQLEQIEIRPATKKEYASMLSHIYHQNNDLSMQLALLQQSINHIEQSLVETKENVKSLQSKVGAQGLELAAMSGMLKWFWAYGKNIIWYGTAIALTCAGVIEIKKILGY